MRRNLVEDPDFYKISKFDIARISFILLSSAFFIGWLNHGFIRKPGVCGTALIYVNNKLLEKFRLEKDKEVALLNGRMQIEVKNGKIRVKDADCPEHLCVNMGWIQYGGQNIVCVPNKVMIEIASGAAPLIDAVAN